MKKQRYTVSIFTENMVGLLARITAIFTRRHINIESLTVSETEVKGISRFTVVVNVSSDMIDKVTKQINKIVEVIHAEYHKDTDLIVSQLALYKVDLRNIQKLHSLEAIVAQNNGRILTKDENHIFIEKTGNRQTLEVFYMVLCEFGETEYVRSGRIGLTTEGIRLKSILPQLAEMKSYFGYEWKA